MEKDIIIDGLNIHYDESGDSNGLPLVLMHGWGCTFSTVDFISRQLQSGMHIYSLDLPGHGKSDEPGEVWGVEEYTALVEKFISKLGLKNVSLIGHSFGGRISILLSSRNKVHKVVLVDAAGIKPKRSLKYYLKIYSFKSAKKVLPIVLGRNASDKIIEKWRKKAGSADYGNASPMMRAILSKCVNEDLQHVMPLITSPTLLIWGEEDTATPLSDAKKMNKLISDSGLVSFKGCGHYSFLDNPGGFSAVIKEFFKKELTKK